jgi:hypothetical protein
MTHLRKMMLEELERRNYAQTTTRLYILIGEHALCESLADDHDRLLIIILIVERIEVAPRDDGNAERRKKSRRDDTPLRPGILYPGAWA